MAALKNIWEKRTSSREKTGLQQQVFINCNMKVRKLLGHITYRHGSGRSLKRYESYRLRVKFSACLVRTVWIDYDWIL